MRASRTLPEEQSGDSKAGRVRAGGLPSYLTINFLSVIAASSPLWAATGYIMAQTYISEFPDWLSYRPPSLPWALARSCFILCFPYLVWLTGLYGLHAKWLGVGEWRRGERALRAAGRFRLAYILCWPLPFASLPLTAALYCLGPLGPRGPLSFANPVVPGTFVHYGAAGTSVALGLWMLARGIRRNRQQFKGA